MGAVTFHTEASRPARARDDLPVESTVDTLDSVHLDNPNLGIIYTGVTVCFHSSQAMVTLMFGVAPDAMLRTPSPFAVPTADLISLPGLAFQV